MAYKILLSSLYEVSDNTQVQYFYSRDGERNYYCDAITTVEASTKYILSRFKIDEMIAIGQRVTFDEGDDGKLLELREGKNFYTSDISSLSTYSLFRYRIAQYIDELKIEQQDILDLLSLEEQKIATRYIEEFARRELPDVKINRLFDVLCTDSDIYSKFKEGLGSLVQDAKDMSRYETWCRGYMYASLKDSHKMEILYDNESVKVRFMPTNLDDGGALPVDNILQLVRAITEGHEDERVEIYVALNNDDMRDNYVLMNILDVVDTIHLEKINVPKIFNTIHSPGYPAGVVRDDTKGYNITDLVGATRTFITYGKVDMLVDYWEKTGAHNEAIDKMIYAMKKIDTGLSLCAIREMESGIRSLREALREIDIQPESDDYYSNLVMVLAGGIKVDYAPLLDENGYELLALIKWSFKKKFYQQTMTLIEAKAPDDFVRRGFYYYCNDENDKERVTLLFADERNSLSPHEYWKINDINHYFLRYYTHRSGGRGKEDIHRTYARQRVNQIDNEDPGKITAYTLSDDREAVENLLYAYYHIGDIRNHLNHAEENEDDTRLMVDERDDSIRLVRIVEAIEYFIKCYEVVDAKVAGKENNVVEISGREVKDCAIANDPHRKDRDRDRDGDRNRTTETQEQQEPQGNTQQ